MAERRASRLLGRDTDRDWQRLAEQSPYWAVVTHPEFEGETLDATTQEQFFASGEHYVAEVRNRLEKDLGVPTKINAALDFGCGVGRLLIPMRSRAQRAVGVDIAETMRTLCKRHLAEVGFDDTAVVASIEEAGGGFDWVNSYIVLQHIPPKRGYSMIAALAAALAPGGALTLHVTAFSHEIKPEWRGWSAPLNQLRWRVSRWFAETGVITMYDYSFSRVLEILVEAGLKSFILDHQNHGGHHGFIIFARKPF